MKNFESTLLQLAKKVRKLLRSAVHWWRALDRTYRWKWRAANGLVALFFLASAALPIFQHIWQNNRYELSSVASGLVGRTDVSLTKQLTYDAKTATYQFNKDSIKQDGVPAALQKNSVGSANKSNAKTYALEVPEDFSKGVTYHDTNSGLSFSLVPQFNALNARTEQGHVVFPLDSGNQAVYTLKNNGLKEDIIVPKVRADTMTFSYKLNLPDSLEAKVIPGSGGNIGIYSADPSLFGDISYGSSKDQTLVEQARKKGAKTFLVFGLPSPVIKAPSGSSIGDATARFKLDGNTMSVIAENLKGIKTAITIDPSVVVTSTSDLQTSGNDEGMISFSTAGQITRGGLTGGTTGTWTTSAQNYPSSGINTSLVTVAYNGYLYTIGGNSTLPATGNEVSFAALSSSDGSLGAWATTSSMNTYRAYPAAVAYNGYMYAYGGYDNTASTASVEYAVINSNGTLGTWVTSNNAMAAAVCRHGFAVYNGYLYATGGDTTATANCANTSTPINTVQYAPILGNGDVGTWNTTTAFTTARQSHETIAYNGYLYVIAGTVTGAGGPTDVLYAAIASNGTVGTWQTTTSVPGVRYRFGVGVSKGYLYLTGGAGGSSTNDTIYTGINANGTVGTWQTTSSFTTPRYGHGTSMYNGYIYVSGGSNGSSLATTEYAKVDPAGMNLATTTTTVLPSSIARAYASTVVFNGYIYVVAGASATATGQQNAVYAKLGADGTIGAWSTSGNFAGANGGRNNGAAAAYNGYLYYFGGRTGGTSGVTILSEVQYASLNVSTGAVGTWATTTALAMTNRGETAWAYNGKMYVAGGYHGVADVTNCSAGGTAYCDKVVSATISGTGTLGAWSSPATNPALPGPAWGGAVAQYGNYVYFTGGNTGGAGSTAVYESAINSSGVLGSWLTLVSFPNGRSMGMAGISGGYLYVWGGDSSGTIRTDVQFAQISNTGAVSFNSDCSSYWCSGGSIGSSYLDRTGVVANSTIYTTGGVTAGNVFQTESLYAPINNGGSGSPGTWTTSGNAFTTSRNYGASVAYNGYMYLLGGQNSTGTRLSDVQYTAIAADGSIGAWSTLSSTPLYTGLLGPSVVAYNGYMYVLGGIDNSSGLHGDVYYAPIKADGTLGAWQATQGIASGVGRFWNATTIYNGYIYMLGGSNNSTPYATDYYAAINSDGTLSTWATTTSLPSARDSMGVVAANGYMYVIGGEDAAVTLKDVLVAPINSIDGTLGAWVKTTDLSDGRMRFGAATVLNGYIYIAGGYDVTSTLMNDVQYAQIQANGTLGPWAKGANNFTNARVGNTTAIYNGTLYLMGGAGAGYYADTQYVPLASISRIGNYSKLVDLGSLQNLNSMSYTGTLAGGQIGYSGTIVGGQGALTYYAYDANGSLVTSGLPGAITPGSLTSCTSSVTSVRYVRVAITLDDSATSVFPDAFAAANNTANVQDFTLNYIPGHPATNLRLRHGQTLQAGGLSNLDTCI